MQRKLHGIGSLPFKVEQNLRRAWERFTWCIANHAKRKQRNTVLGAAARNEFCLHINGGCACGLRDFLSLVNGIDYRRHRQKIRAMDERTAEARTHLVWLKRREIFRKQEITGVQFIVKRACKTGANQTIELSILKEACHPLTACFFADPGLKNPNRAIVVFAVICFVPWGFLRDLFPRRRRNAELSAGKANVTAIISSFACNSAFASILFCRCFDDLHNEALFLGCSRRRLVRRSLRGGGGTWPL